MTVLRSAAALIGLVLILGAFPPVRNTTKALHIFTWRGVGPPLGARVADLAVPATQGPFEPHVMYVAFATGGIWKTENGGASWVPIFDHEPTNAIFSIAVSKSNPQIIWAATGDYFAHHSTSFSIPGKGLFRSVDGGKTWSNMGFTNAEFLGRVVIDPTNPDVVYVGVLGPMGRTSGIRGVYKTTDGGKTWQRIHFVNEWTGTVDLAMDPTNPSVLYAADLQLLSDARRRALARGVTGVNETNRGPGSGIYKTLDGGLHWVHETRGLPSGSLGRIGLAVSPSQPNIIYADIPVPEARRLSGLYRSNDAGRTWKLERVTQDRSDYWGRVFVDPHDSHRVYTMRDSFEMSNDGGKTVKTLLEADGHAMWIDPANTNHIIFANDRGLWYTWERDRAFWHFYNIPTAMIISVAVDHARPLYHILASLQDHDSYTVPSSSENAAGIRLSDWHNTDLGEDVQLIGSASDPHSTYVIDDAANGYRRYITAHYQQGINPLPHVPLYCCPNSSLATSPFDPKTLYVGVWRLYKSIDRGRTWSSISGRFTSRITAIAESPRRRGYLFMGTASGTIQYSSDIGKHWTQSSKPLGVPSGTSVTRIVPSRYSTSVAYATLAAVPTGDFHPYVIRTGDGGKHWRLIASNLPSDARTWTIVEDPHRQGVLFLATNDGVFFTPNDGRFWQSLRGNMPPVAVTDIALQPDFDDLIAGTLGRGVYILDDIRPLETVDEVMKHGDAYVFPIRNTPRKPESKDLDMFFLDTPPDFIAPNAPNGVVIDYYVPPTQHVSGTLVISDQSGKRLQTFPVTAAGLQRAVWDMRAGVMGFRITSKLPDGTTNSLTFKPLVPPGRYRAELELHGRFENSHRTDFAVTPDPEDIRSQASYAAVWSQELFMARLLRGPANAARRQAELLQRQLTHAAKVQPRDASVTKKLAGATALVSKITQIQFQLFYLASNLAEAHSQPFSPIAMKELQIQLHQLRLQARKLDSISGSRS